MPPMKPESYERRLVEAVTSQPGFPSAIGVVVDFVEPGKVCLRLMQRPELLQFSGFFHGGVIAGLADQAAGGAVTTRLAPGKIGVTIDLHMNFLTPADGHCIVARAESVQIGKTVAVARVDVITITDQQERLCAIANVTLRVVDVQNSPIDKTWPRPGNEAAERGHELPGRAERMPVIERSAAPERMPVSTGMTLAADPHNTETFIFPFAKTSS